MAIEMADTVARDNSLMAAPVDGELVVLSLASNHYVGLDATGRRIWDLVAAPTRVRDLCGTLCADFHAPLEQVAPDVLTFLGRLESEGILNVAKR